MHTSSYSPAEITPSMVGVVPCGAYSVRVGTASFRWRFSRRRTRPRLALLGMPRRALVASVLHDRTPGCTRHRCVQAGAHGYAYARRHRTSSARPPLPLWAMEAEGPAARGHRMVQARGACPTALGASHQQVAHRGCRFNAPAWSSDSLGAHGGDTARKAASTGEVPAIRWMGCVENAAAGGGAAA